MNIVGLIPARGGSIGIPKKSIVLCARKPLLAYTCEAALACKYLSRVILSTDSEEIARCGQGYGVEVPFLRPAKLATSDAPMVEVLQHALIELSAQKELVDAFVLLQPTSPLRTERHINEAIELFIQHKVDTVVSVVEVPHNYHPYSVLKLEDGYLQPFVCDQPEILQRQKKSKVYARNGPAVLVLKTENVVRGELYGSKTFPYIMSEAESIDIDTNEDLLVAERHLLELDLKNER